MRPLHLISLILVIVGAINWGLWGLFQFDLVAFLLGGQTAPASRVVYSLVGLAGLVLAATSAAVLSAPRTAAAGRY
jgi:uncharacterized membrane protein YuzA (DUF378 family)